MSRVWAVSHGLRPSAVLTIVICWLVSALACYIGLPPLTPTTEPPRVDLQLFGLVALAATAGATSLLLHDHAPWMPATSPRPIVIIRAAWVALILLTTLLLGALTTLLLPDGLPAVSGYLSVALIWWTTAVLATTLAGQLAGLLTPLALAILATTKLVPWNLNLVFHPDLDQQRLATALAGALVSATAYALLGSRRDRRRR